jgi:hypothetical protein
MSRFAALAITACCPETPHRASRHMSGDETSVPSRKLGDAFAYSVRRSALIGDPLESDA